MKRGAPLKSFTRLERRTPLRARRQEVGGDHGPRNSKRSYVGPAADAQPLVALEGQPKFPKPAPRSHGAPAQIKRSPMRRSARGTAHSRRRRTRLHALLPRARLRVGARPRRAGGPLGSSTGAWSPTGGFAHLSDAEAVRRRRCRRRPLLDDPQWHRQPEGGKAHWYVAVESETSRDPDAPG